MTAIKTNEIKTNETTRHNETTRPNRATMATKTFFTRNDLPADVRGPMIGLLNRQLAGTFDLYGQTKQAHWNVRGPQFHALHVLFDDLAEELEGYVDTIAERATALGGLALGTVRLAAANSPLTEFPTTVTDGMPVVGELVERYAALAAHARKGIEAANAEGDAGTEDLLTEVSRGLDKALWFLEAHLQ